MTSYEWMMVVGAIATLTIGILGGIVRITVYLGHRFDDAGKEREAQINSLRDIYINQLATLDLRFQSRHEQNIQSMGSLGERISALEIVVLNGTTGRRIKRRIT